MARPSAAPPAFTAMPLPTFYAAGEDPIHGAVHRRVQAMFLTVLGPAALLAAVSFVGFASPELRGRIAGAVALAFAAAMALFVPIKRVWDYRFDAASFAFEARTLLPSPLRYTEYVPIEAITEVAFVAAATKIRIVCRHRSLIDTATPPPLPADDQFTDINGSGAPTVVPADASGAPALVPRGALHETEIGRCPVSAVAVAAWMEYITALRRLRRLGPVTFEMGGVSAPGLFRDVDMAPREGQQRDERAAPPPAPGKEPAPLVDAALPVAAAASYLTTVTAAEGSVHLPGSAGDVLPAMVEHEPPSQAVLRGPYPKYAVESAVFAVILLVGAVVLSIILAEDVGVIAYALPAISAAAVVYLLWLLQRRVVTVDVAAKTVTVHREFMVFVCLRLCMPNTVVRIGAPPAAGEVSCRPVVWNHVRGMVASPRQGDWPALAKALTDKALADPHGAERVRDSYVGMDAAAEPSVARAAEDALSPAVIVGVPEDGPAAAAAAEEDRPTLPSPVFEVCLVQPIGPEVVLTTVVFPHLNSELAAWRRLLRR